jgi:hypothetical protein
MKFTKHKTRAQIKYQKLADEVNYLDLWILFAHPIKAKALLSKCLRKGHYELAFELIKRITELDDTRDLDSARIYAQSITNAYIKPKSYKKKVSKDLLETSFEYLKSEYPEFNDTYGSIKWIII